MKTFLWLSPNHHNEESKVPSTKDTPPQDHNNIEPQMNFNDQPSASPILEFIHVESDEEPVLRSVEAQIDVENENKDK